MATVEVRHYGDDPCPTWVNDPGVLELYRKGYERMLSHCWIPLYRRDRWGRKVHLHECISCGKTVVLGRRDPRPYYLTRTNCSLDPAYFEPMQESCLLSSFSSATSQLRSAFSALLSVVTGSRSDARPWA